MGLNFNKVKCRFVVWLSLNEITLQAQQVSSCCFCAALIMQPRWPRPCSDAHKVNTNSLPQPGNVATSVRPRNSLSNHSQFTTVLQWAWRSVVAPPLGFRPLVLGLKNIKKVKATVCSAHGVINAQTVHRFVGTQLSDKLNTGFLVVLGNHKTHSTVKAQTQTCKPLTKLAAC